MKALAIFKEYFDSSTKGVRLDARAFAIS